MRVAVLLMALFALRFGEARADVFVPADPPAWRSAACSAGAGDVVAAGTGGDRPLRVSVGGGGWRDVPGLGGCPTIAGAADGTTAIAGTAIGGSDARSDGAGLVVRGPGGALGAPIALDGAFSIAPSSVAVAPGGWVAVTWFARDVGLTVLVVRPDGTSARAVLEPVTDAPDSPGVTDEQVGIDAGGNVAVVWRRFADHAERLRVARGIAGAAPVTGADLPSGAEDIYGLALTVAPGGGTLVAWSTGSGVRAVVDGQPAQFVDQAARAAVRLAATLADDGTALLAYSGPGDELVAAERVNGSWLRPRLLWADTGGERIASTEATADESPRVLATLAPGGRAAVAWSALRDRGQSVYGVSGSTVHDRGLNVYGVSGQVGGTWAVAARLSSITRPAWTPSLAPDVAGVPRALWSESGLGVRGASPAPANLDGSPRPSRPASRYGSRRRPTATSAWRCACAARRRATRSSRSPVASPTGATWCRRSRRGAPPFCAYGRLTRCNRS